jgi:molecular chaperone GrpE
MTSAEHPQDPSGDEERPPQAVDTALLQERLEEAEREKDQFRTMAQRTQADLVNYKKRASEEVDELRRRTTSGLLLKIIAIKDDLQRGLDLVPEDGSADGWAEGLRLVMRNIDSTLQVEGVTKTEALGMPFEPWEFEAVQYEETAQAAEGTIVSVFREGYRHQGRVLRAAQVVVAKKPEMEDRSGQTKDGDVEETL